MLDVAQVFFLATVEVFQDKAAKRVWSFPEGQLAVGGHLRHMPREASGQSAAAVDPAANFQGLSQERRVAVAQSEKPNFCWLLSVWWADSREAWRRVVRWLAGLAPW